MFGLFASLLAPAGPAQAPAAHPDAELVPLAYHPYPDASDPFGVPAFHRGGDSYDYFSVRYAEYDKDRNGFDFPSFLADGLNLLEGAPGGDYAPTLEAYRNAYEARGRLEAPATLRVETNMADGVVHLRVDVTRLGPATSDVLALKWALAEDDVYYRPPPALSNGVFVHRFTVRSLAPVPYPSVRFAGDASQTFAADLRLDPLWNTHRSYVAVWLQSENESSPRFERNEVVQAARHWLDAAGPTVQERKAVLVELYTATWCAACLFGDGALNELAKEHGLPSSRYTEPRWRYLSEPAWVPLGLGLGGGLVLGVAVVPDKRGRTLVGRIGGWHRGRRDRA